MSARSLQELELLHIRRSRYDAFEDLVVVGIEVESQGGQEREGGRQGPQRGGCCVHRTPLIFHGQAKQTWARDVCDTFMRQLQRSDVV